MKLEISTNNCERKNNYICPKELSNNLDDCISKIIEKTGFTKYNIEKKPVCTNGSNYFGLLYEIDIKGKTNEGDKELNLFVKTVVPGESDMEIISVSDFYNAELFIYKELAKLFEELQEKAKVPIDERFRMVKMYDESNTEVIIMENVSKKGFVSGHKTNVVSLEFAEIAITELAKFHALSFVIKDTLPDFFETKIKTRKTPYNVGKQFCDFKQSLIKILMNNIDEDMKARVEKLCERLPEEFARHFNDETVKRCLIHADYKPDNILTKFVDGVITQIIPIDYQHLQYGCPVIDFLFFIITSTDKQFRRAHMSHLKDLYHKTMTKFLEYFDIDVNSYYPRHEFEKDFKNKLDYGLVHALIFLPLLFASEDDVPDLTKQEKFLNFRVDNIYKDRIQGIIEDYIEWGII
ncbi:hypothetical protein PYW08_013175 [Mythimna loreyi]|uniref:Uncharacterized protein n=1 Tax=Mythimna loreyi TaxID=667449 RepID=A0ACC2QGS8_9NEOP|nr:hypothetical protein PYW08_013175 [Mythimna loreyi]